MVDFGEIVNVTQRLYVYGVFKASGYTVITDFIEKQTMTEMLTAIGHNSYDSAIYALQLIETSKDKKAQVRSATGHLESAHTAFKKIHSPSSSLQRTATEISRKNAAMMDVWTLTQMALCRIYLAENQHAKQHIEEAQIAFNLYATLVRGNTSIISVFNPSQWAASFDDIPLIHPQHFKAFCAAILGDGWYSQEVTVDEPLEFTLLDNNEPCRQAYQFKFNPTNAGGSASLVSYTGTRKDEERSLLTSSDKPQNVRFSKATKIVLKAKVNSYKKLPFTISLWKFSDLDY